MFNSANGGYGGLNGRHAALRCEQDHSREDQHHSHDV